MCGVRGRGGAGLRLAFLRCWSIRLIMLDYHCHLQFQMLSRVQSNDHSEQDIVLQYCGMSPKQVSAKVITRESPDSLIHLSGVTLDGLKPWLALLEQSKCEFYRSQLEIELLVTSKKGASERICIGAGLVTTWSCAVFKIVGATWSYLDLNHDTLTIYKRRWHSLSHYHVKISTSAAAVFWTAVFTQWSGPRWEMSSVEVARESVCLCVSGEHVNR